MRVLVGMPDPVSRGGPNACEPPFVAALRGLGVEIVEVTYVYGDNLEAIRFATRVRRVVRTALRLRRVARSEKFDAVHLNTSFDTKTVLRDAFTLALLGRSAEPLFLKIHGSDPALLTSGRLLLRRLARYVLGRGAIIGVLSSAQYGHFLEAGVPATKLRLVRNAVPPRVVARSRDEFLAAYDLPAEIQLLLFVSRLIPTKGLLDAVRACGLLRDRGRSFVLCCVGDGPARVDAETETTRHELQENVRFFGYLPEGDAADFYRYCNVLVFPTFHNEGLPVVLLNALAAGLPIVTTRTRGASDYLSEPDTCLWVEPHNPEQLADRIEELLDDGATRDAMADNARKTARLFEPEAVARQYLELYEQLISPRRASGSAGSVFADEVDAEQAS